VFRCDALAIIRYRQLDQFAVALGVDADPISRVRAGVCDEVRDATFQLSGISKDIQIRVYPQPDSASVVGRQRCQSVFNQTPQRNRLKVNSDGVRILPGQEEQVGNQPRHPIGGPVDKLQGASLVAPKALLSQHSA